MDDRITFVIGGGLTSVLLLFSSFEWHFKVVKTLLWLFTCRNYLTLSCFRAILPLPTNVTCFKAELGVTVLQRFQLGVLCECVILLGGKRMTRFTIFVKFRHCQYFF